MELHNLPPSFRGCRLPEVGFKPRVVEVHVRQPLRDGARILNLMVLHEESVRATRESQRETEVRATSVDFEVHWALLSWTLGRGNFGCSLTLLKALLRVLTNPSSRIEALRVLPRPPYLQPYMQDAHEPPSKPAETFGGGQEAWRTSTRG